MPTTALVTGADGGIGSAFCRTLASRGVGLLMVGLALEPLERLAGVLAREHGVAVRCLALDLTRPDAVERITEFIEKERLPEVDLLVNNAGIFSFRPLCETDSAKTALFIDLHVRAVTELSREFGLRMQRNGGGWILNMSSMSCWMPMPGLALYSATKAYIRVLSRALALELADSGVRVMVACPGGIATSLFGLPDNLMRLALRLGAVEDPDRFARKAVDRLLRGRRQYVNGLLNRLSIAAVGATPSSLRMLVKRLMLDKGIRR